MIFSEYGSFPPEMASMIAYMQNGTIIGVMTGGAIYTRNQYMDFMENARASQYKWHFEAKDDLTKKMVNGGIRGAIAWGIRSFVISTTFA